MARLPDHFVPLGATLNMRSSLANWSQGFRRARLSSGFRCGGMITIHGRLADRLVHTSRAFSEQLGCFGSVLSKLALLMAANIGPKRVACVSGLFSSKSSRNLG